ncbi:MAG TPA: hypothetical protein VF456_07820 [Vicinamibacterales bacterium]
MLLDLRARTGYNEARYGRDALSKDRFLWASTLLLVIVTGCDTEKAIQDGPLQLPAGVWTSVSTNEFRVSGPDGDLCLEMDGAQYELLPMQAGVLRKVGGGTVTAEGRLVLDSQSIAFAKPNSLSGGGGKRICFPQSPQMGDRTFHTVEIRPTAPLTVRKIIWWSGKRRPFL